MLGYNNPHDAISKHCKYLVKCEVPHPQNHAKQLEIGFIPEDDVYRLIIKSKLPSAEKLGIKLQIKTDAIIRHPWSKIVSFPTLTLR